MIVTLDDHNVLRIYYRGEDDEMMKDINHSLTLEFRSSLTVYADMNEVRIAAKQGFFDILHDDGEE